MSVLIKGMNMPKSCRPGDCPLAVWACELWKSVNNLGEKKEKHKDCPIVEIPEHGDLIDRDDLLKKKIKMDAFVALEWVNDVDICMARTVIPAERREK